MDDIERELRKKLRGLRISRSHTMSRIRARGKYAEKEATRKLASLDKAVEQVEDQIDQYQVQKTSPPSVAVVRTPAEGRTIAVVGDVYRFLAAGEETNGKYAMLEAIVPPGGGPPPHVHSREEESFYILEGEITFQIGDRQIVATAGMFANMPVGMPHSFKNESSRPAKMLISVAPAGLEKMFFEIGVPVAQGATTAPPPAKEEIEKLLAIAPRYGVTIMLPKH